MGQIQIPLTQGKYAIIDDIDSDLKRYAWHALRHGKKARYPAHRLSTAEGRKYIFLHRIIAERVYGEPIPKGMLVDHIDGDTFNNCRTNLRLVSPLENSWNSAKKADSSNPYKGVQKKGRGWRAIITVRGKRISLGYYSTPLEAHEAYNDAAQRYYGEFARQEKDMPQREKQRRDIWFNERDQEIIDLLAREMIAIGLNPMSYNDKINYSSVVRYALAKALKSSVNINRKDSKRGQE